MKKMICGHCGGDNVTRDAIAHWDVSKQAWVITDVLDNTDCNDCGGQAKLKETDAPAAPNTKDEYLIQVNWAADRTKIASSLSYAFKSDEERIAFQEGINEAINWQHIHSCVLKQQSVDLSDKSVKQVNSDEYDQSDNATYSCDDCDNWEGMAKDDSRYHLNEFEVAGEDSEGLTVLRCRRCGGYDVSCEYSPSES